MRPVNKSDLIDELFNQRRANYEENIRRFRGACQKNYANENGNPFEKTLGEFKESLKESALGLAFKIDELYIKLLDEKNPEKINAEIEELSELLKATTQCFDALKA